MGVKFGMEEWTKFTRKTCLVSRSVEFEDQDHQGQEAAFFSPFDGLRVVYVW